MYGSSGETGRFEPASREKILKDLVKLEAAVLIPFAVETLTHQGVPVEKSSEPFLLELFDNAEEIYLQTALPEAVTLPVSIPEFGKIFTSGTANAGLSPLMQIYPMSSALHLYAATLGPEISDAIIRLFNENDFALANMLDSIASLAADKFVSILETQLTESFQANAGLTVLGYSPGYCGWHISAQAALFNCVRPERIGIHLNESYLMTPIKSVSGVLVTALPEVHLFKNNFDFCRDCNHHSCLPRRLQIRNTTTVNMGIE